MLAFIAMILKDFYTFILDGRFLERFANWMCIRVGSGSDHDAFRKHQGQNDIETGRIQSRIHPCIQKNCVRIRFLFSLEGNVHAITRSRTAGIFSVWDC